MDTSTVLNYIKELLASFLILLTMMSPAFGNSGTAYEAQNPDELIASFAVVSDIHVETNNSASYKYLYETLEGIKAGKDIDAVIYTGDNVMNGQALENLLFYTAVNAMDPAEKNFVLAGNHDLGNSAGDYNQLLKDYTNFNKLFLGEDIGKGYFYRVVNGCYIISLISEEPTTWGLVIGDEQFEWLEGVLKEAYAADAPIFVFNHFPIRYEGGSTDRLANLLKQYDADLFVHGHYHDHPIYAGNFYKDNGIDSINLTRPTEVKLFEAGEGIVIEVYEDEFVVRVRNFITGEWKEDLVRTYEY